MVDITTFKVEGKVIVLKAAVKDLSYFDDVVIDKIYVYDQDGYSEDDSKATVLYTLDVGAKSVDTTFTESQLQRYVDKNLFIVKFTFSGTPAADTPCGMDVSSVVSCTFNRCYPVSLILGSIQELKSPCRLPKRFVDYLLEYEALKLAAQTCNVVKAIALYNRFFSARKKAYSSGCGCHA